MWPIDDIKLYRDALWTFLTNNSVVSFGGIGRTELYDLLIKTFKTDVLNDIYLKLAQLAKDGASSTTAPPGLIENAEELSKVADKIRGGESKTVIKVKEKPVKQESKSQETKEIKTRENIKPEKEEVAPTTPETEVSEFPREEAPLTPMVVTYKSEPKGNLLAKEQVSSPFRVASLKAGQTPETSGYKEPLKLVSMGIRANEFKKALSELPESTEKEILKAIGDRMVEIETALPKEVIEVTQFFSVSDVRIISPGFPEAGRNALLLNPNGRGGYDSKDEPSTAESILRTVGDSVYDKASNKILEKVLPQEATKKLSSVFANFFKKALPEFFKKLGGLIVKGIGVLFSKVGAIVLAVIAGLVALGFLVAGLLKLTGGPKSFVAKVGNVLERIIAVAVEIAAIPIIVGFITTVILTTLILIIINNSAYVVPPREAFLGIVNPYIKVEKIIKESGTSSVKYNNDNLPLTVNYTVRITPLKGVLQNVKIEYTCKVLKDGSQPSCPQPSETIPTSPVNGEVAPSAPYVFTYSHSFSSPTFTDTLTIDTIKVTAYISTESKNTDTSISASVIIGKPPSECPSMWPVTDTGWLSQGAFANGCTHHAMEGIDIAGSGMNVVATFNGEVVNSGFDSCYGNFIEIQSTCDGEPFIAKYGHLQAVSVGSGPVTLGQSIGISGKTGSCVYGADGSHLHYDFRSSNRITSKHYPDSKPYMMPPFVPQDIRRGCCIDNGIPCNLTIP